MGGRRVTWGGTEAEGPSENADTPSTESTQRPPLPTATPPGAWQQGHVVHPMLCRVLPRAAAAATRFPTPASHGAGSCAGCAGVAPCCCRLCRVALRHGAAWGGGRALGGGCRVQVVRRLLRHIHTASGGTGGGARVRR